MGLHDFFWNFHPFSSKMGNFFSARILGVDGEIWVNDEHNNRAQSILQRKKIINFQKNLPLLPRLKIDILCQ
jgi:hypothetical protein